MIHPSDSLMASGLVQPGSTFPAEIGYVNDLTRFAECLERGEATETDSFIMNNAAIEYMTQQRLQAYHEGTPFADEAHDEISGALTSLDEIVDHAFAINSDIIADTDDAVLQYVAGTWAMDRSPSAVYPGFSPSNLGLLLRRSLFRGWTPLSRDLIGRPGDIDLSKRDPSLDALRQTTINLGTAINTAQWLQNASKKQLPEKAEFIESFDGFIHEIDAMTSIAMTGVDIAIPHKAPVMQTTKWARPASFMQDVEGYKIDGFVVCKFIEPDDPRHGLLALDMKLSGPGEVNIFNNNAGLPTIRLRPESIGAVDDNGNKQVGKVGKTLLAAIKESNTTHAANPIVSNSKTALAYGFALGGFELQPWITAVDDVEDIRRIQLTTPVG